MRLPQRSTLIKYGISAAVSIAMAWIYMNVQQDQLGPFALLPKVDQYRLICDAFTIPGLMLILSGALMTVSNQGALDGLSYIGHYMYHMLIPAKRGSTKGYREYVEHKRSNRVTGYGFLYVSGCICMIGACIFFLLYELKA